MHHLCLIDNWLCESISENWQLTLCLKLCWHNRHRPNTHTHTHTHTHTCMLILQTKVFFVKTCPCICTLVKIWLLFDIKSTKSLKSMVQLNLNITHTCKYMRACTHFTCAKVYNVESSVFVACGFVMHTHAIKQSWHTRNAPHEQTHHEHMLS